MRVHRLTRAQRQFSTGIALSTKTAYTWGNGDLGRLGHGDESGDESRRNLEVQFIDCFV